MENEQLTESEIEAMKSNITLFDEKIIFFKEYPVQSIFSVDLSFDEIEKLSSPYSKFCLIIDLTDASRPNLMARKQINKRLSLLKHKLSHVAYFTGKNILITAAIKFVMYQIGLESYSVYSSKEKAVARVRQEYSK